MIDELSVTRVDACSRLHLAFTFGLTAVLAVGLWVRTPFALPSIVVPAGVTIVVESGSAGPEQDAFGEFWWLTGDEAIVRVVNNTGREQLVFVDLELGSGPCLIDRRVVVGDETVGLEGPSGIANVSLQLVLAEFERRPIPVLVSGDPCHPVGDDDRELLVQIRELEVREAGP